jgi:photosynthetic reaction center H subunit
MHIGAITKYIDVAQIALYVFWGFFAGLVYYLHREDKREGYPLDSDHSGPNKRIRVQGFPAIPPVKSYLLADGTVVTNPEGRRDTRAVAATLVGGGPGSPLQPSGDPMRDGVGPASWAQRADHPDMTYDGHPRIVPMRVATEFSVDDRSPDPRGMPAVGADGAIGGTIVDIWVDRGETQIRYYEVETAAARRVLLPVGFTRVDGLRRRVNVDAILGAQFAGVPATTRPDIVTLLEEDKITGYYGGGKLYATPDRLGPLV